MYYICPNCEKEITYLEFSQEALIYGTIDIETEEYNRTSCEENGIMIMSCSECDEEIENIQDIITKEDDEDNEESQENINNLEPGKEGINLPIPPAINPKWKGTYSGYNANYNNTMKQSEILVCPKCNQKAEVIVDDTIECNNCNKEYNRKTAKKIIPIEIN